MRYVLQYFYYGGCVYAALKKWARALHLLEICLSVPNQQTTSAIQVSFLILKTKYRRHDFLLAGGVAVCFYLKPPAKAGSKLLQCCAGGRLSEVQSGQYTVWSRLQDAVSHCHQRLPHCALPLETLHQPPPNS